MPKSTYVLMLVAVAVVLGGLVYLLRPNSELKVPPAPTRTPETTPVTDDSTIPWPPAAPGSDVEPIAGVVSVTLKTNKGDIVIGLDGTRAPLTVGNFVKLAKDNFYDGTSFHRIIPNFMIQAGDPNYEAQGYVYTTQVESFPLVRGVLAMANSGPATNGSQFFIVTTKALPHLQGKHTPFGVVQQGMDIVDLISAVVTDANDNPVEPIIIEDVVVTAGGGVQSGGLQPLE
jgi:cyclophilin family peptidyl-prolyl cis-trans isomerase